MYEPWANYGRPIHRAAPLSAKMSDRIERVGLFIDDIHISFWRNIVSFQPKVEIVILNALKG